MSLFTEVQSGIAKRKTEWPRMAKETGISLSWIKQVGLGNYASRPIHETLMKASAWLKADAKKNKGRKHGS